MVTISARSMLQDGLGSFLYGCLMQLAKYTLHNHCLFSSSATRVTMHSVVKTTNLFLQCIPQEICNNLENHAAFRGYRYLKFFPRDIFPLIQQFGIATTTSSRIFCGNSVPWSFSSSNAKWGERILHASWVLLIHFTCLHI